MFVHFYSFVKLSIKCRHVANIHVSFQYFCCVKKIYEIGKREEKICLK